MLPSELTIPQVTILTPTWNRRHLLPRLYDSLIAQHAPHRSFEWLVVDDGSTDGTSDWLETLIPGAPFPIRAIRQENGGKHRALNRAAKELLSPWVLIVDSDDWLLPGAIERILKDSASARPDVLAIIAPREIAGQPPRRFALPGRTVSFAEWMEQSQVGDTSIIMRSSLLREHPFPEFETENFVAESSVYASAFAKDGILFSNANIVRAEYQADGLSARSLLLRTNNSLGAIATYGAHLEAGVRGRHWLRSMINFHRFYWHALRQKKKPKLLRTGAALFFLAPGWIFYISDLKRLKND